MSPLEGRVQSLPVGIKPELVVVSFVIGPSGRVVSQAITRSSGYASSRRGRGQMLFAMGLPQSPHDLLGQTLMQASRLNSTSDLRAPASPVRSLAGACIAHALHDGFADLIYVLLPVWQAKFAELQRARNATRPLCRRSRCLPGAGRTARPSSECANYPRARDVAERSRFRLGRAVGRLGGAVRCPRRGRRW